MRVICAENHVLEQSRPGGNSTFFQSPGKIKRALLQDRVTQRYKCMILECLLLQLFLFCFGIAHAQVSLLKLSSVSMDPREAKASPA